MYNHSIRAYRTMYKAGLVAFLFVAMMAQVKIRLCSFTVGCMETFGWSA